MDKPIQFPYKAGEAVYYLRRVVTPYAQPVLTPAVVTKVHRTTITILRTDGLRRIVAPDSLIYRGYCGACQLPAIDRDAHLYCPSCCQLATPEPPPDALILRWLPKGHDGPSRIVREYLTARCSSWKEAWERVYTHDRDALIAMLRQTGLYADWLKGEGVWENATPPGMQRSALLGDATAFLAAYREQVDRTAEAPPTCFSGSPTAIAELVPEHDDTGPLDGPGSPSRRRQLPAITIARSADDAEPDGADELTAWLDRQFKRAA